MRRLPEHYRQAMCSRKKSYPSKAEAQRVLNFVRDKKVGLTKEHRPYQCPFCYKWHIGRSRHN